MAALASSSVNPLALRYASFSSDIVEAVASWVTTAVSSNTWSWGTVSVADSLSRTRESHCTWDLAYLAPLWTCTTPLYTATPPSADMLLLTTLLLVRGARCHTLAPFSFQWGPLAAVMPTISVEAPSPLSTVEGKVYVVLLPMEPSTQCTLAPASAIALLLLKFTTLRDQFCTVVIFSVAPSWA